MRPVATPKRIPLGFPVCAALAVLVAPLPAAAAEDDADEIWECGAAIGVAEGMGIKLPVTSQFVIDHFVRITKGSIAAEDSADAEVRRYWTDIREKRGQGGLQDHVLETAGDCADLYVQAAALKQQPRRQQQAAAPQAQDLNSLGTLSAAALRAYAEQTGDAGAVADYLVYHYPYGKDLFKPNEDGDYLGELIASIGANGVKKFSDEAIYAIAYKHYWQYNPPASRIVDAEYRRRLRVQRQTVEEGQRWAQRAAEDRARRAREANAKPVGSLGKSCEVIYRPAEPGIAGSRVVKCR